jgi:hypothetical protein
MGYKDLTQKQLDEINSDNDKLFAFLKSHKATGLPIMIGYNNSDTVEERIIKSVDWPNVILKYPSYGSQDSGFQKPTTIYAIKIMPYNTPSKGGGCCYVATCVYGSYDCPEVWTLRRYRDQKLSSTLLGKGFIKTYYFIGPTIIRWFGHKKWFVNVSKKILNKVVASLQKNGVEYSPYDDAN